MSIKGQAVAGIKWASAGQVGQQILQFGTSIVLARLLSPSDFGLVAMAMVVVGFLSLFKDLGTASAIIQHKNPSETLLSSIFWTNMMVGSVGMAALLGTAPLIAVFYKEARVTAILQVLSVIFVASAISIVPKSLLERNLAFRTVTKIETGAMAVGCAIGIASALLGAGVWSIVFRAIAEAVLSAALLWAFARYRVRMSFDWQELKTVGSYSLNLTGFNVVNYFARNADYILIGRFLGPQNLGYYTLAYRIMLYPLQNISYVIGRVMFPVFSQIQQENERFQRGYLRVTSAIAFVSLPMMLGLMGLSEPFVLTVFEEKWRPVILLITILAPVGMLQSILTTVGTIYQAKGRTDRMLQWGVAAGLLTVLAFVVGLPWGIVGVAVAYATANLILAYPGFAIPFRLIDLKVRKLASELLRPLVCSLVMLLVVVGLRVVLSAHLPAGWVLALLIPVGVIVYLLCSWAFNRNTMEQLLEATGINPELLFGKSVKAYDSLQ